MTNAIKDLERLPDGLGVSAGIDGRRPLPELTAALTAACDGVEDRTDERSVVVLRIHATRDTDRAWPGPVSVRDVGRWERAVRRLERLPAMTIAVAEGTSRGPALDLLLASDFRIGTPDLVLVPPVNDGHFWPGMSVFRLVQHLGAARARQIVLWGDDIEVRRACALGLVDQVSDDIPEAIRTAAVLMGRISDRELQVRRQLLLEAGAVEYEEALGMHLAACDRELRRLRAASTGTPPDGSGPPRPDGTGAPGSDARCEGGHR
ncbi:enoyl-CoA-hydratase DpgB [Streptomyces sp. NPDC001852]|uniref:enoyl-CoA-hydratase DpgB n=1 Tax=Streptomyces sp. NPDC001852 TaxID=3364619 RepID=UPI0036821995